MMETEQLTKSDLLKGIENVIYSRKVARNTVLFRLQDGTENVKYHDTIVVVKSPDGTVTLNSGGFRTQTTMKRFWEYGHINVSQMKGVWYAPGSLFYDGIQVKDGKVLKPRLPDPKEEKHVKVMKHKIKKYVELITPSNMPQPGLGDCFYCSMRDVKTGKTMGDAFGHPDTSHLLSHLKEGYVVGSLLVNALKEDGMDDHRIGMVYSMPGLTMEQVRRAVTRYLTRRLLPEIAPR